VELARPFRTYIDVGIRTCSLHDLPALEWWGMYGSERPLIRETFEAQQRGEAMMLVAVSDDFPVGQAWLDLVRDPVGTRAFLWAVRVLPGMRRAGIGRRLIESAETVARMRGFSAAVISVEPSNPRARALYERLGYHALRDRSSWPESERGQTLLQKSL